MSHKADVSEPVVVAHTAQSRGKSRDIIQVQCFSCKQFGYQKSFLTTKMLIYIRLVCYTFPASTHLQLSFYDFKILVSELSVIIITS